MGDGGVVGGRWGVWWMEVGGVVGGRWGVWRVEVGCVVRCESQCNEQCCPHLRWKWVSVPLGVWEGQIILDLCPREDQGGSQRHSKGDRKEEEEGMGRVQQY